MLNSWRSALALISYASVTLAASLALSVHFFLQPLRPWPDQSWMLQAAIRHAEGRGLTTQMNNTSRDLTVPTFERLVYFPPGYPVLISSMIRAGFGVEAAVKVVNLVALFAGILGWLWLGIAFLELWLLRTIYCALLVLACGGIVVKGGTTDLIFWAGVPLWIYCITRARTDGGTRKTLLLLAAAGVTAVLISVRWAAVFLVPVGIVTLMFPWPGSRRQLIRLSSDLLAFAVPPTLAYLIIGAINRYNASNSNVLSFIKPGWRPQYLLTIYPFDALFAIPLGLSPLIERIWRSLDPTMKTLWGTGIFRLALPLMLMMALLFSARYAWRTVSLQRMSASALLVILEMAIGLVGFLSWMALRYNWDFVDWSFLSEPRYYRPFLPAFLLGWLILLQTLRPQRRTWLATVTILLVCSIYLFQAAVRSQWSLLHTPDESLELVNKVRSLGTNPGLNVVFDIDISDYIVQSPSNLIASNYLDESTLTDSYAGQPATFWIVRRTRESTAYVLDRNRDAQGFEALQKRFAPKLTWTSSGGSYELYAASVH